MSENKMSEELEFIQKREPRRFRDINNDGRDVHEKGEAWVTCPSVTLEAYENLFKSTARKHNALIDAREEVEVRDKTIVQLEIIANEPRRKRAMEEANSLVEKAEADLDAGREAHVTEIIEYSNLLATAKREGLREGLEKAAKLIERTGGSSTGIYYASVIRALKPEETEPQAPDGKPSRGDFETCVRVLEWRSKKLESQGVDTTEGSKGMAKGVRRDSLELYPLAPAPEPEKEEPKRPLPEEEELRKDNSAWCPDCQNQRDGTLWRGCDTSCGVGKRVNGKVAKPGSFVLKEETRTCATCDGVLAAIKQGKISEDHRKEKKND